jgi:hypothetical protein
MSERTMRWAGAAGIGFVVLILITVFSAGQPPAADDSVADIRDFFVDHRNALLISNLIALIAIPLLIWFAVVLREMLRGDATTNAIGTASLAGLLVTVPVALAGGAIATAPVYLDGSAQNLGNGTLRIVFEAQSLVFAAASAGLVLFTLMAALAIWRTSALPAYTMWLALLAAVGNTVAVFSSLDARVSMMAFVGILSLALFVLVTGITMAFGHVSLEAAAPRAGLGPTAPAPG